MPVANCRLPAAGRRHARWSGFRGLAPTAVLLPRTPFKQWWVAGGGWRVAEEA